MVRDGKMVTSAATRRERAEVQPTPMPTKEVIEGVTPSPSSLPTPRILSFTSPLHFESTTPADGRSMPEALYLNQLHASTDDDLPLPRIDRLPNLASIELVFHLHHVEGMKVSEIMIEMEKRQVDLPSSFNINDLLTINLRIKSNCVQNVKRARERFVKSLGGFFPPSSDQLLYDLLNDAERYSKGGSLEAENYEMIEGNKQLSLDAVFILRHIMYSHKLSLPSTLTLWSSFHALITRRVVGMEQFSSQSAIWNKIQRLHYLDNAIATERFQPFIQKRTPNGFRRCFSSSSDDSIHHDCNRHVLITSSNISGNLDKVEPSYRHITSSVNAVKSESATKNSECIINMFGLFTSSFYGGCTNDNAGDAQKEIKCTFSEIMDAVRDSEEFTPEQIHDIVYENGVERRPIVFGDPYHIANLCMTWASIYAFGDTEKCDHSQVHHRQVLQSIHTLHSKERAFSQAKMDEVMMFADERVLISPKRERIQRWLVNQHNAAKTLEMMETRTTDGVPSLVAWALTFANESRSDWKKRVGQEIATWLSMPSIILGLQFEAELGSLFEEIYAWHNRTGPLYKRSGFRMMEIFDLYFGFEVPWWNEVVEDPASKLPKTMKY